MTDEQEREFHELAVKLEDLSRRPGWEAMRYQQIGQVVTKICEFCHPEGFVKEPTS